MIAITGLFELVTAVSAAAAPTTTPATATLEYSGPEELKGADLKAFSFSAYRPGDLLFVAAHDVNLRAAPNTKADLVATLPMATQVKVRAVAGGRAIELGKVDQWYQVEVVDKAAAAGATGYLFGMVLTPAAYRLDLDGDGALEVVTVAFTQAFKIRVRVREPQLAEPSHTFVDLEPAGGAFIGRRGGLATVKLVPRQTAGVDLVEVFAHVEACADDATHWVSYTAPAGERGRLGTARVALSQMGMSDPPTVSSYEVRFDAKARTARVVRTQEGEDDEGAVQRSTSTTAYRLVDGVYQEEGQRAP